MPEERRDALHVVSKCRICMLVLSGYRDAYAVNMFTRRATLCMQDAPPRSHP